MNNWKIIFPIVLFGFLLVNLAPTNGWLDSSGLASGSYLLGINHPPAEPLYTILGKIAFLLPFGNVAFKLNLLSSICLIASFLLFTSIAKEAFKKEPSFLLDLFICGIGLLVYLSWSFMIQGVRTELYALNLLLSLSIVYSFSKDKLAFLGFFLFGLSLGCHHLLTFMLVPGILVLLYGRGRGLSFYITGIFLALLGASIFIYLPLRAHQNPLYSFGSPDDIVNFWWVFSGKLYSAYESIESFKSVENLIKIFELFSSSIPFIVVFGFLGLIFSPVAIKRTGISLILIFLSNVAVLFFNMQFYTDNPDAHGYLMISFCMLGVGYVVFLSVLLDFLKNRLGFGKENLIVTVLTVFVFLIAVSKVSLTKKYYNKSNDYSAYDFSKIILLDIPSNSYLLASSFTTYSLLAYKIWAERYRSDVNLVYAGLLENSGYRKNLQRNFPALTEKSENRKILSAQNLNLLTSNGSQLFLELSIQKRDKAYSLRYQSEILNNLKERNWFFKYSQDGSDEGWPMYKSFWEDRVAPRYESAPLNLKQHIMLGFFLHSKFFFGRGEKDKAAYLIGEGIKLNGSFTPLIELKKKI